MLYTHGRAYIEIHTITSSSVVNTHAENRIYIYIFSFFPGGSILVFISFFSGGSILVLIFIYFIKCCTADKSGMISFDLSENIISDFHQNFPKFV